MGECVVDHVCSTGSLYFLHTFCWPQFIFDFQRLLLRNFTITCTYRPATFFVIFEIFYFGCLQRIRLLIRSYTTQRPWHPSDCRAMETVYWSDTLVLYVRDSSDIFSQNATFMLGDPPKTRFPSYRTNMYKNDNISLQVSCLDNRVRLFDKVLPHDSQRRCKLCIITWMRTWDLSS